MDRVKIAHERDAEPVIAVDLVVTADDDTILAVVASAQHRRGVRADAIEIDGGVPGRVHSAKLAIRLFHQQRDRGVCTRCGPGYKTNNNSALTKHLFKNVFGFCPAHHTYICISLRTTRDERLPRFQSKTGQTQ